MAVFIRLVDFNSSEEKEIELFNQKNKFIINNQDDFLKIPGSPIAYWISNKVLDIFPKNGKVGDFLELKAGLSTGDNKKFQRNWHEVNFRKIGFNYDNLQETINSKHKWYPCNSGGEHRKWYGNNDIIINWEDNGRDLKKFPASVLRNKMYYFKEGITWTKLSASKLGIRFKNKGFIFDDTGRSAFSMDTNLDLYLLSFLGSKIPNFFMSFLNPSLSLTNDDISKFAIIFTESKETKSQIDYLTQQNIDISRKEWNSRETSWDFKTSELLRHKTSDKIEDAYNNYCANWKEQFFKLHANEEELNRIFIDIYDLADEMTPDVPFEDVTILKEESEIKNDELVFKKEIIIKQFISYAVGCMFGRYSPDKEGLILANKGEIIKDFTAKVPAPSFIPDDDNIIPVLEDEYFKDDIVSRFKEFLKVTFGAESLAENLDFIAGALSKSKKGGESSEKIIRDYFLKSFFKDHARTYQKRPIYWLFTSGKGRGFNALVYMHRYDKTLLAKMRTDYLLELEAKLDARIAMLSDSARDKQEKERLGKLMRELAAYDEKLNNKALGFIDIDLDDGVVVNYAKFEGLVEGV